MTIDSTLHTAEQAIHQFARMSVEDPFKARLSAFDIPGLIGILPGCRHALEIRGKAWVELSSLVEDEHFVLNRTLRLQAYLSATWSLYDQLSACAIRLSAVPSVRALPFPSLYSTVFTDRKEGSQKDSGKCDNNFGFNMAAWLREEYGWAIGLSYKIRNVFLHEAGHLGGKSLFAHHTGGDIFELDIEQRNELYERVERSYRLTEAREFHRFDEWPTFTSMLDLLQLLEVECDAAVGIFAEFAVRGVNLQHQIYTRLSQPTVPSVVLSS